MSRHLLALLGGWLATLSVFAFAVMLLLDWLSSHHNPYSGLVAFVILPMLFVLGLLLIPLGAMLEWRRRHKGLAPRRWPRIDLNNPIHRRTVAAVMVLTLVNLLVISFATYRGAEYMESTQFCGQVCHTVMQPEFMAHQEGPHSRVPCVECHVGSGAKSYAYYKLNGVRQLVHLVRGTYPRPIPSPVFNLRPARATCEACHAPELFHGDKVALVSEFANDEKNTSSVTRLLLHVGGGMPQFGLGAGIHWHTNPRHVIDFVATDPQRQDIPYVRFIDEDGTVREYRRTDAAGAQITDAALRRMDCVDCHNRATHAFFASPERAVDAAMARGAIPVNVPFARREAVKALSVAYADRASADRRIGEHLRQFYRNTGTGSPAVDDHGLNQLIAATQFLYSRSIFPAMSVTWGTHPNNLGHTDAPGCFRCHDDNHVSADGHTIRQDCDLCHEIQ